MSLLTSIFPKKFKTFFKKFRKFNALNKLDQKMLDYINYSDGFFIECGANDGVDQSNTWYFEKYLNWNGILIEPLKKQFIELKKNRSQINHFYNVALCAANNINSIEIIENDLVSKSPNKFDKGKKISNFEAMTLTKILDEVSAPNLIDFFSLDVEGFEDQVIKGINFNKYNFKFFLIETTNDSVVNFLNNNNYNLIKKLSHHDLLFEYKK